MIDAMTKATFKGLEFPLLPPNQISQIVVTIPDNEQLIFGWTSSKYGDEGEGSQSHD